MLIRSRFHFNADPDPAFHFNADLDPAPHQCDANLRPLGYRPCRPPLSLHAPITSLHFECPWPSMAPFSEPRKLLNLDLMRIRIQIQLFTLMWIRIQFPKIMRIRIRNPATEGIFLQNFSLLGPGLGTHEVREQIQWLARHRVPLCFR